MTFFLHLFDIHIQIHNVSMNWMRNSINVEALVNLQEGFWAQIPTECTEV